MSNQLPENLFPAAAFFQNTAKINPTIFTVLIYSNQETPLYVAWFHNNEMESITVYKNGDKWLEKRTDMETVNSRAIGIAIENYNPFK